MQVNDLVKVTNPKLETDGQAGIVVSADEKRQTSAVKLDSLDSPLEYKNADLTFLGR